jgi:outer membrane immunogenic protein
MIRNEFSWYFGTLAGDDMKKLLLALAGLAVVSSAARAADLPPAVQPYKAPAIVAPAFNWSGIYLNAGGGFGMWNADTQAFNSAGSCLACFVNTFGGRGYIGTVGGGFDYQVGNFGFGNVVVGVLGDYNFESLKGTMPGLPTTSAQIKETNAWSAGARIGLAFGSSFFAYTSGGATGTRFGGTSFVSDVTGAPTGASTAPFTKTGYFLGGGTETSLTGVLPVGWFLRSEYRYDYFNVINVPVAGVAAPGLTVGWHPVVQTLTTSIMYKFNWQ